MLLHSLQSALLFGVFETARLIGRLGAPLLFLGKLFSRQSRRLAPVELVDALVGHPNTTGHSTATTRRGVLRLKDEYRFGRF